MRKKLAIGCTLVAVGYFALTWFFFGSPHPCGILEARLRPFYLEQAEKRSNERREMQRKLAMSMMQHRTAKEDTPTLKEIDKIADAIEKDPGWALDDLHRFAWETLTPPASRVAPDWENFPSFSLDAANSASLLLGLNIDHCNKSEAVPDASLYRKP
ncbi:MAG: hypothetical protein ACREQA_19035 [Candidatus Binatia bacterium]